MATALAALDPALRKRVEEAIRREDAQRIKNRATLPPAHMEQGVSHAPLAKGKAPYFDSQVDVHFHSIRKRLADPDGLVGKYSLDAIVRSGILADDTAKQIRQVTHSQEKGKKELTVITITAIG